MSDLYCVYKHTTPNGKVYIGQTRAGVQTRWRDGKGYTDHKHGWFWKAIQKYGWENIKHEVLYDDCDKETADYYEKYFISIYQSTDKRYGYNCQTGGSRDYKYTDDSKKNISDALKRFYAENGAPDTSSARAALSKKQSRRIAQYDLDGNKIAEYESAYDAYIKTGISNKKINQNLCIPHRVHQAGGYIWKYAEGAPGKIEPYKRKPKILYIDDNNNILGEYTSRKKAAIATGISASTIGNILDRKYKSSKVLLNGTFVYGY